MVKLYQNFPHEIVPIEDFPHRAYYCFSCICDGRLIVGGGKTKIHVDLHDVFEYTGGHWKQLPPYSGDNGPSGANLAAAYIDNHLVVCGGYESGGINNIVYILRIDANYCSQEWVTCQDRLPVYIHSHQLTYFMGKLILTGGIEGDLEGAELATNRVWEGTFHDVGPNITWRPLPSMRIRRPCHVALALEDKLFVIGGGDVEKEEIPLMSEKDEKILTVTTCEYFNGKTWKIGPDLDYPLYYAAATPDRNGRSIIIGGKDSSRSYVSPKLISFHPKKGFQNIETVELPEPRYGHVALLC